MKFRDLFFVGATLCATIASASALAQAGKTFVVALPADPNNLNSSITTEISSSILSGQVYSTIVRLDKDGNPQPYLAESWDIAPDGLTYTFHFPDDIKWHDGTPFTVRGRGLEPVERQQEIQRPRLRPAGGGGVDHGARCPHGGVQAEISLSAAAARACLLQQLDDHPEAHLRQRAGPAQQPGQPQADRHRPVRVQGVSQGQPHHASRSTPTST